MTKPPTAAMMVMCCLLPRSFVPLFSLLSSLNSPSCSNCNTAFAVELTVRHALTGVHLMTVGGLSLRTQTGWNLKVRIAALLLAASPFQIDLVAMQERLAPFRPLQASVDRRQYEITAVLEVIQVPTAMQWNSVFRTVYWNDPTLLCLI